VGKISSYAALTIPAAGDLAVVVDVSDTSMAGTGTDKKIALSDLFTLGVQLDSNATDITADGNQSAGVLTVAARGDHCHPLGGGLWLPSDSGQIAWAFDPGSQLNGGFASASGTIYLIRINFRAPASVTNVVLFLQTVGATLTAGDSFAGLYAGQTAGAYTAGQRIGTSADQATSWSTGGNANSYLTVPLTGGPFSVPAGFCWAAVCSTGTTPPTWGRGPNFNATAANSGLTVSGARWATNGSGTSLPSSITPASNVFLQQAVWAGVS
jgi:hypothetical protein